MTATDRADTGARRHPGRGAVRAALAVRRDVPAAADRRPRRRPGACPATAPDRQPRAIPRPDPTADTSITVAFTYTGLEALGVPQASLDSFAPEFREGMAARAAILGDTGESSPEHWEKPLGTGEVHVAIAALSPDPAVAARPPPKAPGALRKSSRESSWSGDRSAISCRPAGPRSGSRTGSASPRSKAAAGPRRTRGSGRLKAGEIILGYPDETGELPPMPTPGGPRPQRHLRGLPQAAHQGGRLPPVPARPGRGPRRRGPSRREDGRTLAQWRTARARPEPATTPNLARTPAGTTTSGMPMTRAASNARSAPTPDAPTRATPSTTTGASTSDSTG